MNNHLFVKALLFIPPF